MLISDLMWLLSETQPTQRNIRMVDFHTLNAYHVTNRDNLENIKANGLRAYASEQSYTRPSAVYLFVDKSDIDAQTLAVLGIENPVIIKVKIPAQKLLDNTYWDGLFNVSFDTYSAIQYRADIPSDWLFTE